MKIINLTHPFLNRLVAVLALCLLSVTAYAQYVEPMSGNLTPNTGTQYLYTSQPDLIFFTTPTATLTPSTAGTIDNVVLMPDGYTIKVWVTWTAPGSATVKCWYNGSVVAQQAVTVSCATTPAAPTISIITPICGTSGSAVLQATPGSGGDNIKWYSASTGGTLLFTGMTYNTPTLSTATTYYAASTASLGNCIGTTRTAVTVNINAAMSVPTAAVEASRCGFGSVTINATPASPATSIRWYSAATNGELLATGTSYSPVLSGEGEFFFFASSYNTATGCTSATRLMVKASVNAIPGTLYTTSAGVYGSGVVELIANQVVTRRRMVISLPDTTEVQVRWYADSATAVANGAVLAKGVKYTTGIVSVSTPFFIRLHDKPTGCLGPPTKVIAPVYPLVTQSSIKTEVVRVSGKTSSTDLYTLTTAQKSTSFTYFDGLGRPVQQVGVAAAADGGDLIQPVEYDALGRVTKQYLPYTTATSTGTFQQAYVIDQATFYQNTTNKIATDAYPYAKSTYEDSPLGRPIEQTSAGQAFQPGSGHTNKIVYGFNTGATASEAEEVRKFNADGTSSGFYAANVLSRTESTDADGNKMITFTSPAGKTLAVKRQVNASQFLETYNIYDDFGQLRFTIQPEGVAALKSNGWNFNASGFRAQHVFEYLYDMRGRVIETRVPGKGASYTIYNQLNQPVLSQDQQLRNTNQWLFVKYDRSGRTVMTGLYTDATGTRASLQLVLDNKNYAVEKHFETRDASTTHKYTNVAFPTSSIDVLSVTYYDNYNFDTWPDYTTQQLADEETQGNSIGRVTGTKTLIPGTSTWLKKIVYYDVQGRVIQVRSNNHLNTTPDNLTTTSYDFEKVLQTKTYHKSGTLGTTEVLNTYEYYDQGRLKQVKQKNNTNAEQLVVRYEYNKLGQVVDKKLHGTGTPGSETFLQSVDYRYTLNGQLASINNATLDASGTANDDTNDYFGMELVYHTAESELTATQRYNGMVSAVKWKGPGVSGNDGQRSYAFSYDKSGRMENAAYAVKASSAWNKEGGAQDEVVTYDRNGNILTLQRKQRKYDQVTASYTNETIDNLTYAYKTTDKNSLEKVTDAASTSAAAGFDNGSSSTNTDYTYDSNGNVLSDANKGITSIVYNFLGKPTQVNFSGGKKIEYVYDAGGNKLTQKLYQGTTLQTTTEYVNGFVYEATGSGTPVLSFFGSPEGRVVNNGSTLNYEYSIADHQGNTRVVFTSATPTANTTTVNFESATNGNVLNYTRTNFELFDHTDVSGSTYTYSQKLTGASGSQVGVAKTMKVYPGDKVKIEAYAKYYNPTATSSNITGFAAAITGAFGVSSASTGEMLKAYNALNNYGGIIAAGGSGGSSTYPKLFVNILLFDKDYNLLDAAWEQINGGEQVGATPKAAHDYMSREVTVKEAGFAYVFISHENPTLVEFYVDDVVITHTPTNVIQYNEYYPFGLQTSTSWTRDNAKDNNYLYNAGSEFNKITSVYDLPFRNYDAALGRFMQVDPLAVVDASTTPYSYASNNPAIFNDPTGLLTASREKIGEFIVRALNGNGGTWSDDERKPKYFDSDREQAKYVLNNWSMFGFVTDQEGGSGLEANALMQVAALAKGNQGSEYVKQLREFLASRFKNELITLNKLAKERGVSYMFLIEKRAKGTRTSPRQPGETSPVDENGMITVYLNKYLFYQGDSRLMYTTIAHELVHVEDVIVGNDLFWTEWYGEQKANEIMEYRAYKLSERLESELGVDFGSIGKPASLAMFLDSQIMTQSGYVNLSDL